MLMKEGWEYKELGEVAFYSTNRIPSSSIDEKNYVGVDNLLKDRKGKINATVVPVEGNCISYECGDILVGNIRPYLKKIWLANRDGGASGDVLVIRTNNHQKLQSNYLYWVLANDTFFQYNMLHSKGAKMPRGNKVDILKYIVPIPSFSEQQHIVEELELLSSIIEKKKAQLKELDNLAQSLFYEMFGDPVTNEKGWDVRKLADISKEKLSYGSGASAIPYDGKMRYIRITDINDSGELNDNIVSPNSFNEKYLLNDGDILFARSGATVGKTYYHKVKNGKCIYAGYLIRLIPNADIVLPSYVFGYTKTQYYMEFVKSAQNAVAQPNINAKQYGNLDICIPPLSLQQQFTSKIEAIEQQKELIKKSIKEVETLFNSRMDYYFN